MNSVDPNAVNVSNGGSVQPNAQPTNGTPGGSVNPGSPTVSTDGIAEIKAQVAELTKANEKLVTANEHSQKEIGRLGLELGDKRQEVVQQVDITAFAEEVCKDLDSESPIDRLRGIAKVTNYQQRSVENDNQLRASSYLKVIEHDPAADKVSYSDVEINAMANGWDLKQLNTPTGMKSAMDGIAQQRAGTVDLKAVGDRAVEEYRAKVAAEAAGIDAVNSPGGTQQPAAPKVVDDVSLFLQGQRASMGYAQR